jgi:hypothetical protein
MSDSDSVRPRCRHCHRVAGAPRSSAVNFGLEELRDTAYGTDQGSANQVLVTEP